MLKKFDAIEYLVKKYVDDGEHATIPIWLEKKEEFFNSYDPTDTSLSPDIYEYIDKCSYHIPLQYRIRLDIVCNDLDDETKEKMKNAVRNHYGLQVFENNLDLKGNTRKTILLLILGFIFVAFVYLGNKLRFVNDISITLLNIIQEVILITGWVFIWAAVENASFNRKKLKDKRNDSIQLFNAKFIFENEKEYYKILEEEQKEEVKEKEEYEEIRDSFLES